MAFTFKVSEETRRYTEALSAEMVRLHGLSDRWLGEALLRFARDAVKAAPARLADPTIPVYDVNLVWQLVPEIAKRLGAGPLKPQEATDPRFTTASPEILRTLAGVYLANAEIRFEGGRQRRGSADPSKPNALEILGNEAVNGNPIEMAISRLCAPFPPEHDKNDPLARQMREVAHYRGKDGQAVWSPSFNDDKTPERTPMNIPFPPMLAETSALNAAASNAARQGKGSGDHLVRQLAAYRTPEGVIRTAYDLCKPEYPEGSEPGLCDVNYALRHYANDTSGYDAAPFDFRPASELLAGEPDWANPSVAVTADNRFIVARNEAELASALEGEGPVVRGCVTMRGLDGENPPAAIALISSFGSHQIYAGASPADLIAPLEKRLSKTAQHADPDAAVLDLLGPQRDDARVRLIYSGYENIEIAFEHDDSPEPI